MIYTHPRLLVVGGTQAKVILALKVRPILVLAVPILSFGNDNGTSGELLVYPFDFFLGHSFCHGAPVYCVCDGTNKVRNEDIKTIKNLIK